MSQPKPDRGYVPPVGPYLGDPDPGLEVSKQRRRDDADLAARGTSRKAEELAAIRDRRRRGSTA